MAPFEVLISESQERMLAIVEPDRWDAVRAVCERWGLPVAVIGRVTADGDIAIVDASERRRARPDPGRGPDERRDRPRAGRRAAGPPPRGARPGRARSSRSRTACRSAAWTRARSSSPCSDRRTSPSRRAGLRAVRLDRPGEHGRRARATAPPCPDQGHDEGARRLDRREPGGRRARSVARRGDERRRGDPQRRDHRRAAARRDELPELRRPDPARGVLAAHRGRPRPRRRVPRARAAGDRRQRLALQRVAGGRDRPDAGDRRRRAARGRRRRWSARAGGPPATGSSSSARSTPGLAGSAYAALAGLAAEDGPPALDLDRERRLQAFVREAADRGPARLGPGRVGRRARRRARGVLPLWATADRGIGALVRLPRRELAGRRPVRREPVAARRLGASRATCPALVLLARQHGLPIEELGEVGAQRRRRRATRGPRLVVELHGSGATGAAEDRGSRVADALIVGLDELRHAWEQRPGRGRSAGTVRGR